MKSVVKIICLVIGCLNFNFLKAQSDDETDTKINIEKFIENSESTSDYTDLYDQIEYLQKHPVNINMAGAQELSKIPLITPMQIQAILSHRKAYGDLKNVYELQQLEGFEVDYIKFILSFISVAENITLNTLTSKAFWKDGQHEIVSMTAKRLEKSKGYQLLPSDHNAYLGNPFRQVLRYRGDVNEHLQVSFTTEKDAGEKVKFNTLFVSGGLFIKNLGRIKTLAIGDFQAAFGQGLTFGSGLSFGKSPFVLNMMRNQNGLRAYYSLNENEFLRGIGTVLILNKKSELNFFYSGKKIDGTAIADTAFIGDGFSSLINTGYHRSFNELEKKDALQRKIIGTHFTYQDKNIELGLTAVKTVFNQLILPGDKLYQKYNFKGNTIDNYGLDYKWFHKNLIVYGEVSANTKGKNLSGVNGLLISMGKNMDLSFLHRHYDIKYIGSITNAIGESTDNRNENGFYAGLSISPFKGYKLNAYADLYRFNWLRYLVDAPSGGKDILLELQYTKRKSYSWYLRFRNENKQKNEEGIQHLNRMENNNRTQLRFHIEHNISAKLSIRNRIEFVQYQLQFGKTTQGFLMFQDFNYAVTNNLKLTGRLMYFDVQDYDARLYAYESDMLYTYTVPAFQDRGTRFYFLIKYKLKRNIDIWGRFARTSYENINVIGSSYDQIEGSKVTDIKIQLKWTL